MSAKKFYNLLRVFSCTYYNEFKKLEKAKWRKSGHNLSYACSSFQI